MDAVVQIIQTIGFPIAAVLGCAYFIYKLVTRYQDEASNREEKLIDANVKYSEVLDKVADTIQESNNVNKELSQTNKILVGKINDKLETVEDKIDSINNNINKLANHS